MGTKERLFWVVLVFVEAFAILVFANGCKSPQPPTKAALAPSLPVSCPAGYKAVSRHEGHAAQGNGFIMVPYTVNGKSMHLFCTQDDGKPDARINKSPSGSIPPSN